MNCSDDDWSDGLIGDNLTDEEISVWNNDMAKTVSDTYPGILEGHSRSQSGEISLLAS